MKSCGGELVLIEMNMRMKMKMKIQHRKQQKIKLVEGRVQCLTCNKVVLFIYLSLWISNTLIYAGKLRQSHMKLCNIGSHCRLNTPKSHNTIVITFGSEVKKMPKQGVCQQTLENVFGATTIPNVIEVKFVTG